MRALVVGYGSIGARHARILRNLGCSVAVVSRHASGDGFVGNLEQGLETHRPDYVVIANRTVEHAGTIEQLVRSGFDGWVLVEKPLFDQIRTLPRTPFKGMFLGYNLRFHPILRALRERLDGIPTLSAQIYVGQYLPHWRPGTDYRDSCSALRAQGGGVLRDLSHEIDYVLWLFGRWRRLTANGGHYSSLEITSDDVFSILASCEGCPDVNLSMNYLDTTHQRRLTINLDGHTLVADLIGGTLQYDGEIMMFTVERDETYVKQHQAMIDGRHDELCQLGEGMEVMTAIDAAERAAESHVWIMR